MSDESTDMVEYLRRNAVFNYKDTYLAAADEIERLRAERDEARRALCYWWDYSKRRWNYRTGHNSHPTAVEWADICYWDCFKEKP